MSAAIGIWELRLTRPELAALAAKIASRAASAVPAGSELAAVAGFLVALLDVHRLAASSSDAKLCSELRTLALDVRPQRRDLPGPWILWGMTTVEALPVTPALTSRRPHPLTSNLHSRH